MGENICAVFLFFFVAGGGWGGLECAVVMVEKICRSQGGVYKLRVDR